MQRFLKSSAIVAGFMLSSLLAVPHVQAQQSGTQTNSQQNSQPDEPQEGNRIQLPRRSGEDPERDRTPLKKTPSRGGIDAKITLNPTCSIVGPARDCTPRPYIGAIRIERLTNRISGRGRVLRTQTDSRGRMQIQLEPGLYTIQPETGSFPITTKETVRVFPQRLKTVEIVFHGSPEPQQRTLPGRRTRQEQQR